jgi:membrane associated rhomboid family serine protease
VANGEWYRLISSGFLHFNVIHIAMNMLLLFQLGQLLEPALGRVRFGLLYFASLLGGSLGALIMNPYALSGGASGAVFGLMAAAAVGMHRRGVNVFRTGIGTVLVLNLVFTFAIPGISVGGHLGGAIAGAVCGYILLAPKHAPVPEWATYALPVAVALGSFVVSLAMAG